jgi:hypothetical protein
VAAAHVEKARRIATEAKTRQPVEERVEEARVRGEAVGAKRSGWSPSYSRWSSGSVGGTVASELPQLPHR